jgi:hypothetical protein
MISSRRFDLLTSWFAARSYSLTPIGFPAARLRGSL